MIAALLRRRFAHAFSDRRGIDAQFGLHGFAMRHRRAELGGGALVLALALRLRANWRSDGIDAGRHRATMTARA